MLYVYAIARPSVCLSHGWIIQQEAKLSLG